MKNKELNMACVKNILVNDIKDLLGHEPSKAEFKSALEYLDNYIEDTTMLVDVETILRDWRNDCCKRCKQCDEYFLSEFMEEIWVGQGFKDVCSVECGNELRNYYE